jgi:hypothetical protein
MFAMANQLATLLLKKHDISTTTGREQFVKEADTRWKPVFESAHQYAQQHNISKHQI